MTAPRAAYRPGSQVSVSFVGAYPNNDLHRGGTYLEVQHASDDGQWRTVADDGDWSTKFHWARGRRSQTVTITWDVPPDAPPGRYRIRYLGDARTAGGMQPFNGTSPEFELRTP